MFVYFYIWQGKRWRRHHYIYIYIRLNCASKISKDYQLSHFTAVEFWQNSDQQDFFELSWGYIFGFTAFIHWFLKHNFLCCRSDSNKELSKTAEDGDGNVGKTILNYTRQKAHVNMWNKADICAVLLSKWGFNYSISTSSAKRGQYFKN